LQILKPPAEANFIKYTTALPQQIICRFSFGAKKEKGGKKQSIFGLTYDLLYFFGDA